MGLILNPVTMKFLNFLLVLFLPVVLGIVTFFLESSKPFNIENSSERNLMKPVFVGFKIIFLPRLIKDI